MRASAAALALSAALAFAPAASAQEAENTVTLETSKGEVVIELREDLAPGHAERIRTLVEEGFYDGVPFHRVIAGFMAQTGDPTGTGMGGSEMPDLEAEFTNTPFVRGSVGMARAGDPDSANSQFFIVYDRAEWLDGQYTYVGDVTSGMEVVDELAKGSGQSGMVADPDVVEDARLGS